MLTFLPLLWLAPACTSNCEEGYGLDSDGSCKPYVVPGQTGDTDTPDPADTGDPTDSGPGGVLSLEWGDPIPDLGGHETEGSHSWEFVDVVALDDEHALGSAQGATRSSTWLTAPCSGPRNSTGPTIWRGTQASARPTRARDSTPSTSWT